jgi:uncharacterized protein (DUF1015 family)
MSIIIPFKALRPKKELVREVASWPYDVVNTEEAKNLVRNNPLSFLHVEKSEIDVSPLVNPHDDRVYEMAKSNMQSFIQRGILFQDTTPCFYIYRQRMEGRDQYGIVAGASLAEYESGRIKKHEFTRKDKEEDRTRHVDVVNAQTGPVFLTYKPQQSIDSLVEGIVKQPPEYDFIADDGIAHTAWVVNDDNSIESLKNAFMKVDYLYIADGHHRAAAAAAVRKMRMAQHPENTGNEAYHYVLAVLFPSSQLKIMDYNRVVKKPHDLTIAGFFQAVSKKFAVSDDYKGKSPVQCHEFGMYVQGRWYKLTARDGSFKENDPIEVLDVSILQKNLLEPILGIKDPREDKRIDFVGGIRGMKELERLVDTGLFDVAFSLYPATLEQLMDVADSGKVMPPKSTWFEPKLRSGIFVHLLT